MKYTFKKEISLRIAIALLFVSATAIAQDPSDLAAFLQLEQANASKLISAYSEPFVRGAAFGMTTGWYHTAKAHKTLGFDLGVTMTAVFIPSSDNIFDPNSLGLTNTTFSNVTSPGQGAPTVFGNKDVTQYTSTYTPTGANAGLGPQTVNFNGPEGLGLTESIGFSAVPMPMIQLGIGIIKNTDLKIRYMPEQTAGASRISMLGFGLMHDIKQHIPGIKEAPFDLSVLVAYNSVTGNATMINDGSTGLPASTDGNTEFKFNSWVVQGLISKKLAIFTFYGGLGYGSVSSSVDVKGTYTVAASPSNFSIKDPVAIRFDNSGIKFTAGFRLNMGPVYLNSDYTFQKYDALTLGLGVTVR